jgi:serine/threonine protein kinase
MHADLQFGRQIGKGACSTVKIAHHRKTGENYAVKMFNIYDEVRTVTALHTWILILRYP